MNISFDLDSTLIPNGNEFETEKGNWKTKLFKVEKLRKGTQQLISFLQEENHSINVYTTSFRSKQRIRFTFWCYNIKIDRIVNQTENQKVLKSRNINSSKYPKAFDFDLHIDDSKGVGIESEKYNFNALIVSPDDLKWDEKVIAKIKTNG